LWILPQREPTSMTAPINIVSLGFFTLVALLSSAAGGRYRRWAAAYASKEESLRASLKELNDLRTALDQHSIVAITDAKGIITNANAKFCAISQYSREELLGRDHRIVNSGFHPKEFIRGLWTEIAQGRVWQGEIKNRAKDGSFYWVDTTIFPVLNMEGKPLKYVAIRTDITKRKQAEEDLQKSEERWRYILEVSELGAWALNLGTQEAWRSLRHDQIFGYSELLPEWTYPMFLQHVHAEDREKVDQSFQKSIEKREEWHFECRIIRADQAERWIWVRSRFFEDPQGKMAHMLGMVGDITERKLEEAHLRTTVTELRQANADLEQFAYVASHDLQEPLRAIAGCIEILEANYRDKLGPEAAELIRHTVDGARRMQALINDLLAYARVAKNGHEFELTDSTLALNRALANLSSAVIESAAAITHDPLPTLLADPKLLPQLFQNIISNGIKFCKGRTPEIHVSAKLKDGSWLFSIRDNGIGIAAEYRDRLFVLFRRLHNRTEYPGTGIGLAICKRIVERHNGKIWLDSEPGKGSTFYFTIPEKTTPAPSTRPS